MKLNFQFPARAVKHWEKWVGDHHLADVAVAAEAAGFDMVSSTDHPFPEQNWLENGGHHAFDPFVSLAFMAAATQRIRVMTFILVSAYRHPYVSAKAAASLDLLSGGRLTVGMGAGYQKAEFDVLDAEFADRGKRFDAAMKAMQAAWTGEVLDYDDEYFPAHGHVMLPRPAQRPGPPIWIGGNSRTAVRRVAQYADGWCPFEQPEEMAKITSTSALGFEQLQEKIAELTRLRVEFGRSPEVDVCYSPHLGRDLDRNIEILNEGLPSYAAAGVTWMTVDSTARSFDDCMREIELYGSALKR
jgi:probable F420-dependent oxidoreductase